jgi:hypothetical protein
LECKNPCLQILIAAEVAIILWNVAFAGIC